MAKKTVNIGTSVNKGDGDPLRTAFGKINDNFNEIYGAIGVDGSIFNPLSVDSNILPDADNTRDLGSAEKQWRHVYTAGGSIYLDNIKLTNNAGKLEITKVINPGEANEAPDPIDSDAGSELGGGGGVSVNDFGEGFTDALDDGKITTSKLYNKNPNPGLNNQYTLEVTNGGVVALPDGSIINGATLKTIAGNYAGITAGPQGADEDSWMWVDNNGATIATKYSTDANTWTFDNDGRLTFPQGTTIATADGTDAFIIDGAVGKDVQIYTYGNDVPNGWTFGTDGALTLPAGGTINNTDGIKLVTDRGTLAIGTNMEAPGVAGHFHIAFDGSNSNPPASDLFLGDDHNYVKLPGSQLNPATYGVEIGTDNRNLGPQNIEVDDVDELVPPGGVWRLFIIIEDYPNLGSLVSVGDTVTTSWGTPITATVTGVVEAVSDGDWQIQVDQDITAGFSGGDTVSFGSSGDSHTWRFGTDGSITFPDNTVQTTAYTGDTGDITFDGNQIGVDGNNGEIKIRSEDGNDYSYTWQTPQRWEAYAENDEDGDHGAWAWIKADMEAGINNPKVFIETVAGNTGVEQRWTFDKDGALTFPDGSIQTTAYTGQTSGGGVTVSNVWVQTFETDAPATDLVQAAVSVEYDSAGNIVSLFSHYEPESENTYYSVGKYTTTGTRIWTVRFADDFNTDGWGLAVDNDAGFIYIAGQTTPDGGQTNATLTKISGSDGTIEWSKKYDFGFDSSSAVVDVASDGNPVMVGYAEYEGDRYVATTKVDAEDGTVIWSRKLNGQNSEQAYGMAVGPSGEVVVIGYMDQLGVTDAAETLYADPVSNANWTINQNVFSGNDGVGIRFDVSFTAGVPTFTNVVDTLGDRTVDGTVATILGSVLGGVNGVDDMTVKVATLAPVDQDDHMLVVKYNSSGAIQWQKAVLFDNNYDTYGADADIDSEGNVYVTGQYEATVDGPIDQLLNIVKFNSSGVEQWSRRIQGNCGAFASSIVVGPDDKLYLSATTFTGTNSNDTDIHLVLAKYEFDGTVAWQRLLDYTDGVSLGSFFFGLNSGGSNLAVKQDYLAVGLGFSADLNGPEAIRAAMAQISTTGDLFTVGSWDFKPASFSGYLSDDASDIGVVNANKVDTDNLSEITTTAVTLDRDSSNFLIGTLYSTAEEDNTVGFTILADGTLQASAGVVDSTVLTDSLTNGRPDFLMITPRSPDRDTLDTDYGFDSTGMWFTGDNEATLTDQPAYPIHTRDSFPADAKVVVEFDVNKGGFKEDHSVCVYPANGIPHWSWSSHPSRIAAMVDGDSEDEEYQAELNGLTGDSSGAWVSDQYVSRARFTYDPLAELTTFELLDVDGAVTSRCQTPGRLARGQDYMIGFDADWDNAGVGERSYFSNLTITTSASAAKTTELTASGEIKLPNTVRGFVNMQGPWSNNDDDIQFQTVTTHDGFAYMGGETDWTESNSRIDKYSLTTGELVWSRVIGAGRGTQFDISWTGGVYTITNIPNLGLGYKAGDVLYVSGSDFTGGSEFANRATITVQSVGDQGNIVTATIAGTAPGVDGSVSGVGEQFGDAQGFPTSIKYDTITDTVVVLILQTTYGNTTDNFVDQVGVIRINPVSGDVVSHVTLTDEGDIYGYDVAIHPTTGATAVVGAKFNEYKQFGALVMAVEGNGYFDILKSNLDAEHYPGNQIPSDPDYSFLISGTGITGTESVDSVNFYESISGTTQQGSGTVDFDVATTGTGPYAYGTVTIDSGGLNYRVGHKIKYLGTQIPGGTTPENDLILTVDAVDGSGTITAASASGTAPSDGTIMGLTAGTNYNVGSGLTLNITVNSVTGSRTADLNQGGSNYVVNDVVVIAGTQFAGGTTPTNDVTVTIMEIGLAGGNVTGTVVTAGTTPTNIVRIRVDGVDFTVVDGAWTLSQNLDSEAFVWTPTWNKAIGSGTYDRFQSVVYSKDGASIYAVGDGYYEVAYKQSLVVKFATSDGAIGFSKYLNTTAQNAYATGVATIGASDIVVSGYERVGEPVNRDRQFVARLNDSGTVVWKKYYSDGNWGNSIDYNSDIQVDSDDNIYVTIQLRDDNTSVSFSDGFTVTKLDRDGNLLWSRCVSSNDSSYLGDTFGNRWSSLHNDQLVVAGYTYETDDDYYNGLWASFPTDGFVYSGGEDEFVQMGAFRFGRGRIKLEDTLIPPTGSFTPSVQPPNITAVTNFRNYATRTPSDSFPQHLHKMVDPKHGGLVFGDGSRQTTAADRIPQIRADNNYTITANDSGKHIYLKNNSGTITIPGWWKTNLPVGFTFTIVNRTGNDCYVQLEGWPGPIGTILGAGRNISTDIWGIPDSGSGSMVTLILLESAHEYGNDTDAPVWMISGPGDIYDDS
jgi:hypothetical protein